MRLFYRSALLVICMTLGYSWEPLSAETTSVPEGNSHFHISLTCNGKGLDINVPIKDASFPSLTQEQKMYVVMSSDEFKSFIKDKSVTELLDCYWGLIR
jgi:hypothetical protein